jgi:hypothetical protein
MTDEKKITKKPKGYYSQYNKDSRSLVFWKKHTSKYEILFSLFIFAISLIITLSYNSIFGAYLWLFIGSIPLLKPIYKRKIYKFLRIIK